VCGRYRWKKYAISLEHSLPDAEAKGKFDLDCETATSGRIGFSNGANASRKGVELVDADFDSSNDLQIAYRLRYSDLSAFTHSFSRWTGKSPSTVRIEMLPRATSL
jgi:hypothetical protein